MSKRLGLVLVAIMLISGMVPFLASAEPTREPDVVISSVDIKEQPASGGEYSVGEHVINITLTNNAGSSKFLLGQEYHLNITWIDNGTVFHEITEVHDNTILGNGQINVMTDPVYFPEGEFNITVNTTIDEEDTRGHIDIEVTDVVDLSVMNQYFTEGGTYSLGQEINPICSVKYEGNVDPWKDDVQVHLIIETAGVVSETLYDQYETVITMGSAPVSPNHNFSNIIFTEPWIVNTPGEIVATFSVEYEIYNEENNVDQVTFTVENPPVIEGWINTTGGDPLPGVSVEVRDSSNMLEAVTETNSTGYYQFMEIDAGTYTLFFIKRWTSQDQQEVTVTPGMTVYANVSLEPLNRGGLRGYVKNPDQEPIENAFVVVDREGGSQETTNTNETGYYEFQNLDSGVYTISAIYSGYEDARIVDATIIARQWNEYDLVLGDIPFEVFFDPPAGEPGFPVGASVSMEFTREIDPDTVDQLSIKLLDEAGDPVNVEYDVTPDNRSVVLTPVSALDYDINYTMEVNSFLRDVNGEEFPGTETSYFYTEVELLYVEIVERAPYKDQSDVRVGALVKVVFSVSMDKATINVNTFKLQRRGGVDVDGQVNYYDNNNTAIFIPFEDLQHGTTYNVILEASIQALDERYIYTGGGWAFDTLPAMNTGVISGKVLDENDQPFSPASVKVVIQKGTEVKGPRSPDFNGEFEFLDVDEGIWKVTITVDNYKTVVRNVTVTPEQTTDMGNVKPEAVDEDENGEEDDPSNVWIIVVIGIVILLIIVVIIVFAMQKPRPLEAEEMERRPRFGGGTRERIGGDVYGDEFFEGEFLCPVCGGVTESTDEICPHCGAEFEEDLFECPECGASIPGEALECPECGAVFEEEEPEEEDELYEEEEIQEDLSDEYEMVEEEEEGPEYLEEEEEDIE